MSFIVGQHTGPSQWAQKRPTSNGHSKTNVQTGPGTSLRRPIWTGKRGRNFPVRGTSLGHHVPTELHVQKGP